MTVVINFPANSEGLDHTAWERYRDLPLPSDPNPTRWVGGVSFRPLGCVLPEGVNLADLCVERDEVDFAEENILATSNTVVTEEDGVFTEEDDPDLTFEAFLIEAIAQCPVVGGKTDLADIVESRSRLARSRSLAAQVERGLYTDTTPSFVSEATNLSSGALPPTHALAFVEAGLGAVMGDRRGMIHVSPLVATLLLAAGAIVYNSGVLRTVSGHVVVVDSGYAGPTPGTGVIVAGSQWVYGSGPVYFKSNDLQMISPASTQVDRARNVQTIYVQQYAVAIFEPCTVVAAQANISGS